MTPFHSAAENGKREVIEVLIENRCNIHAKGPVSKTVIGVVINEMLVVGEALAFASRKGHLGIVKRLIGSGLDVNHKSGWVFNLINV